MNVALLVIFYTVVLLLVNLSKLSKNTFSTTVYTSQIQPSPYFRFLPAAFSTYRGNLVATIATIMNIHVSLLSSTLSILCYFNKHFHAKVVSDLVPIQYLYATLCYSVHDSSSLSPEAHCELQNASDVRHRGRQLS